MKCGNKPQNILVFEKLTLKEDILYQQLASIEKVFSRNPFHDEKVVSADSRIVREDEWMEGLMGENNEWKEKKTKGKIWSDAIQEALDHNRHVYIPYLEGPLYIDRPLILHPGNSLRVHPETEIRLKPYTNTCMLRNENIVGGEHIPMDSGVCRDEDIIVEGGIWNAISNEKYGGNGNEQGQVSCSYKIMGAHSTFLFSNVKRLGIFNLKVKESTPFAIQIGNCEDFAIEGIEFVDVHRDGVHVEGPANRGIIRRIRGKTGDDIVALNAWDWKHYSLTFGPISNVLVEDIEAVSGHIWSELRLLAGRKKLESGTTVECDIQNCIFKNIRGIHTVKAYSQPNLEIGPEIDFSETVGNLSQLYFTDMELNAVSCEGYYYKQDAVFEICSDIDGMVIRNVTMKLPAGTDREKILKLAAIGPLSAKIDKTLYDRISESVMKATGGLARVEWEYGEDCENNWDNIFDPYSSCTVKNLVLKDIFLAETGKEGSTKLYKQEELIFLRSQIGNENALKAAKGRSLGKGTLVDVEVI